MLLSHLKSLVAPLLGKIINHPFNHEIHSGNLPLPKFKFYLEQDGLYLSDLAKVFLMLSKRMKQDDHKKTMELFAHETLRSERDMHHKYLGSNSPALFQPAKIVNKIPVIADYTTHILSAAENSPLPVALMSVTPCFWIYSELGKHIQKNGVDLKNPYKRWIDSYSSPKFGTVTEKLFKIDDEISAMETCPIAKRKMVSHFIKSTEFELKFWDAAFAHSKNDENLKEEKSMPFFRLR